MDNGIKFKSRILIPLALVFVFLLVAFAYVIYLQKNTHAKLEYESNLHAMGPAMEAIQEDHAGRLATTLEVLRHDQQLLTGLHRRDRESLLRRASPVYDQLKARYGISHWCFLGPDRVTILSVDDSGHYGHISQHPTVERARDTGKLAFGVELARSGALTLRVVVPWWDNGELVGYMELGEHLDSVATDVGRLFGVQGHLLLYKRYLHREDWEARIPRTQQSHTWDRFPSVVLASQAKMALPAALTPRITQLVQGTRLDTIQIDAGGHTYIAGFVPFKDVLGREVGQLALVRDITFHNHHTNQAVLITVGLAGALAAVLFGLFYAITTRVEGKLAASQREIVEQNQVREALQEQHIRELEHQALYDRLTDLPNRALLQDRLAHEIASAHRNQKSVALIVLDVSRLKEINDTLGHETGDLILQRVAHRLRTSVRKSDTVARIGGDEFAVLLPTVDLDLIRPAVEKLQAALERPFNVSDVPLDLEARIGVALYPDHGFDPQVLLQRADIAMRLAKEGSENFVVYDAKRDPYSLKKVTLFGELRHAIHHDELALHYQPKLDIAGGRIIGVEALVRWNHPKEGLIAPDEFIPLAEKTGLINPLTYWVLDMAIRQCRAWLDAGLRLQVSVNISARNLMDPKLAERVDQCLEKHGIAATQLDLELTETAIMAEPTRTVGVMRRLTRMGVTLSIDDYGTGYSSLAYLKRLPVWELKIDRSFVSNMADDEGNAMIVHSTIDLAHNMGRKVVAEGVETQKVLDLLTVLGCDVAQGYYIGKPLPADEFIAWLEASPWRALPPATPPTAERRSLSGGRP